MKRLIAAALAAFAFMVMTPVISTATDVCVSCDGSWAGVMGDSNGKIIVQQEGTNCDVWPGRSSTWSPCYFRDIDYFWVPGGCDAYSEWNYKYTGNRWYGPLNDIVRLRLTVRC